MINFGKDVFDEGLEKGEEIGVEKTMLKVITKFLQRGMTFNDVVDFLTLSKEEEKYYAYLLQKKEL